MNNMLLVSFGLDVVGLFSYFIIQRGEKLESIEIVWWHIRPKKKGV